MNASRPPLVMGANLLKEWLRRDLRVRYTQTFLGGAWALAQPIALTVGFVYLAGRLGIQRVGVDYPAFVFSSIVLWTLFSAGIVRADAGLATSLQIASKFKYPRLVAPLSGTLVAAVDFLIGCLLLAPFLLLRGVPIHFRPLLIGGALVGTFLTSVGLGLTMSALSVFIRDIRNVLPLLLQVGLILTPVLYSVDQVHSLARWNPMATFLEGWRHGLFGGRGPAAGEWLRALLCCCTIVVVGVWYFRRVEARFADVA